ncbi:hypothetical protein DB30_07993 [Enhygromyxa salina]|uniref:Uncharacterized protein n=1 Tax=Enhygromyxa salina TaxID=215803 RepID=A0A0C2CVD4_9BACT|nr:hypothetical protein DB30_07993 [Enhygromyxa salina]
MTRAPELARGQRRTQLPAGRVRALGGQATQTNGHSAFQPRHAKRASARF